MGFNVFRSRGCRLLERLVSWLRQRRNTSCFGGRCRLFLAWWKRLLEDWTSVRGFWAGRERVPKSIVEAERVRATAARRSLSSLVPGFKWHVHLGWSSSTPNSLYLGVVGVPFEISETMDVLLVAKSLEAERLLLLLSWSTLFRLFSRYLGTFLWFLKDTENDVYQEGI